MTGSAAPPRRGHDLRRENRSGPRYSPRLEYRECRMNVVERPVKVVPPELLARFAAIVGARNALTDANDIEPYMIEDRGLYRGRSPIVLRPGSTAEVSAILKLANETGTPIVPQGGNTGLVGGQTPHNGEVLLSLKRMDRIREVDATSNTMTCEAGVVLIKAQEAAEPPRTGCFRSRSARKEAAPSAATSRPMPAAPVRSPTASRASW